MRKGAKPRSFDPTGKNILDHDPLGFVHWLGFNATKVRVLNSDLTKRLAADRLILVDDGFILNIELQAQYDPKIRERMLAYAGLIALQYGLPVINIVILLNKAADGEATRSPRIEFARLKFEFEVKRLWEESPESFFGGSPSLLALLPLSNVADAELPDYIRRIFSVIAGAYEAPVQKRFWGDTLVYMGLKHDETFSFQLLEGVFTMLDLSTSTTYQGILAKGKAEGEAEAERRLVMVLGTKRFGEPDAATRHALDSITAPKRLEALASKLLDVESWRELLQD
jgi:hypothetical protein